MVWCGDTHLEDDEALPCLPATCLNLTETCTWLGGVGVVGGEGGGEGIVGKV